MKIPLSPAERSALRARAHHLDPVVMIGNEGLTPAVLHEIDVNLQAHELIKIRVFADERAVREDLLARIADEMDAAAVQHIGKLLVVYRPQPGAGKPASASSRTAPKPAARTAEKRRVADSRPGQRAKRPATRKPASGAAAAPAAKRPADRRRTAPFAADPPSAQRGIPGRRRKPPQA